MMSLPALRAEHLAPFATRVLMTAVKTEKASVGDLQLLNTLSYVAHRFTILSPMTFVHKIHRMVLLAFGSFER
jgi:hypothetical protein